MNNITESFQYSIGFGIGVISLLAPIFLVRHICALIKADEENRRYIQEHAFEIWHDRWCSGAKEKEDDNE